MANYFRRLINVILGKNAMAETMPTSDVFKVLRGVSEGIANIGKQSAKTKSDGVRFSLSESRDSDFAKAVDKVKTGKVRNKFVNMRAQAMADYACAYFKAVKENARINLGIALLQQAASFYFADKQHDVAKQAQNRFDEIWGNQKDKSDKFFNHWYDNSRPIELRMLNEASEREKRGYQVDYDTAKDRAIATARSEFSRARDKVQRESNIHCVGATRTALRQLQVAEAKAVVLATNSAIRFEEERKHQRESQYREEMYKWNSMFQGRIADSLNSLRTAQQAAAAGSQLNPYEGWSNAVGNLSHIGRHIGTMNISDFQRLNAATPAVFASGFF